MPILGIKNQGRSWCCSPVPLPMNNCIMPEQLTIKYTNCDLLRSVVSAMDQVLAEVDTYSEVLSTSINLGLETLVVVHKQLHTRHITAKQPVSPALAQFSFNSNSVPVAKSLCTKCLIALRNTES